MSGTDKIDALREALDTEGALRKAANKEWANKGGQPGPMRAAHDAAVADVLAAARALVNDAVKGREIVDPFENPQYIAGGCGGAAEEKA